jgi:hypothetical protein
VILPFLLRLKLVNYIDASARRGGAGRYLPLKYYFLHTSCLIFEEDRL